MKIVGAASARGRFWRTAPDPADTTSRAEILPLTSTSEVYVPRRGRAFTKFSFDFPEPPVPYEGLRFGFLVFTRENACALGARRMSVSDVPGAPHQL